MTVYILEDENNILKHILSLVEAIPYLQVVGFAGDIQKAERDIPALKPELILADIQLRDGNSFNLFNRIDISNSQVIFVTAYDHYAIQALNLGALAYLLKPIDTVQFNEAVEKCLLNKEKQKLAQYQLEIVNNYYAGDHRPRKIVLRSFEFTQIAAINDILYCSSDKGYTTFFMNGEKPLLVSKILKDYESLLPGDIFIRCHQSYLVNVNYILRYYKEGWLEMSNGDKVPVSERKKEIVTNYINKL